MKHWKRMDDREKLIIEDMFPDHTAVEIGTILNREPSAVRRYAKIRGLKKSDVYRKLISSKEAAHGFKKGYTPWNLGIKMSDSTKKKILKTRIELGYDFKIGQETTDGRGYILIKTEDGLVYKHRYIWIKSGRTIPEGYILRFKDKNRNNVTLDNLELISLKDIARENANWAKYPRELLTTFKLISKLTKKINTIEEDENRNK